MKKVTALTVYQSLGNAATTALQTFSLFEAEIPALPCCVANIPPTLCLYS